MSSQNVLKRNAVCRMFSGILMPSRISFLHLMEEVACCLVCADLFTLQDTINPITNPLDVAARVSLQTPLTSFRFPGNESSKTKTAKYHQKFPGAFRREKPVGSRSFSVSNLFHFLTLILVPGGGVEPPRPQGSADFESDFRGFARCCTQKQRVALSYLLS
jgi:hypothetical protein